MKRFLPGLSLLICIHSFAQPRDCGTITPLQPLFENRVAARQMKTLYTTPLLMKVFVHITAQDEGYSITRAVSDTAVMRQLENMRIFYAAHGICFLLVGIEQVNNSDLRTHDVSEEAELTPFLVPDVLNIFIHGSLTDSSDDLNGVAYGIPTTKISVAASAIESTENLSTTAHEIGHAFGLYHTFARGFGTENIPRSGSCKNCETAGDLLCDTQADPHNDDTYKTENFISTACNYFGTLQQLCGGVNRTFVMDPSNIMAYGRRACRNNFTSGQGSRANSIILTTSALQDCIAPDAAPAIASQTVSSGRKIFAARNAITINVSNFTATNTARVSISSNTEVTLKPGVTFTPTGMNAHVSVIASPYCR